jgi:hypothetical protein
MTTWVFRNARNIIAQDDAVLRGQASFVSTAYDENKENQFRWTSITKTRKSASSANKHYPSRGSDPAAREKSGAHNSGRRSPDLREIVAPASRRWNR